MSWSTRPFYTYFSAKLIITFLINVDDCLLDVVRGTGAKDSLAEAERFIDKLNNIYKLTFSQEISMFLGLELVWAADRSWVKVTLTLKIEELNDLLKLHLMAPVTTPMDTKFDSTALPEDHVNFSVPYLSILGKVHFIKHWRPDIAVAHTLLSHFQTRWAEYHWLALVRVCTYLFCHKNLLRVPTARQTALLTGPADHSLTGPADHSDHFRQLTDYYPGHLAP